VIDRGVSDKKGDKGGSFGIGKDASYACSELRLVFYSTINMDGEQAFEGVCKLPSFKKDNENYVGWGFFCNDDGFSNKQKPIRESISLDPDYTRKPGQYGMDKFIFGFDSNVNNIEDELVISSINNFLYAFIEGRLIVRISGVEISQKTISELIDKYKSDRRLKRETIELFETVNFFTQIKTISLYEKDDVELVVKIAENLSSRVSIVRKTGIKVHNTKRGLVKNCSYSAVILLEGNIVNTNFKKFENIEHTKWSITKAPEHKEKYHEMINQLNELIKELNERNFEETIDADGVKEFLPMNYVQGNQARKEALTNNAKLTPPVVRKINPPAIKDEDDENESDENYNRRKKKKRRKNTKKDGLDTTTKKVKGSDYKIMMKYRDGYYDLLFSPKKDLRKCSLEFYISGETENKPINISEIYKSNGFAKIVDSNIFIDSVESGEVRKISFSIDSKEMWNLEVKIYESKK
jgi:hypothetical protein